MKQINAYLHLNNKCKEAMIFYKDCFGGELSMQTVGESPMANQMPTEMKDAILHATLTNGEAVIIATDMMDPEQAKEGSMISLCINCTSEEEIHSVFDKLSQGGKVGHALEDTFWGAIFGDLTDKFGINWMLNFDKPKA